MTLAEYEPELGQAVFGQPSQPHECPVLLDAALIAIRQELQRVLWNLRQEPQDPFGNSTVSFRCEVFCVCAYSWSDAPQPFNFKHYPSGLTVSWYKYHGRGMSVSREIAPDEIAVVLQDCVAALRKIEEGEMQYQEPGLYPEGALEQPEEEPIIECDRCHSKFPLGELTVNEFDFASCSDCMDASFVEGKATSTPTPESK